MEKKKDCYLLIPNESKDDVRNKFSDILADEVIGKTDIENERKMAFELFCKHYDLYFDEKIMRSSDNIGIYIARISSFPQYRGLKFKDSKFEKDEEINTLIEALKYDQDQLLKKRIKCLENNDIGTYKNIANALTIVTGLIHEEEKKIDRVKLGNKVEMSNLTLYTLSYKNNTHNGIVLSENGNVAISSYVVENANILVYDWVEFEHAPVKELYYDWNRDISTISFDGNIHIFKGIKCNEIAKKISELIKDENVNVYGDTRSISRTFSDYLLSQYGIKTNDTIVNTYTDMNNAKGQHHTVCTGN